MTDIERLSESLRELQIQTLIHHALESSETRRVRLSSKGQTTREIDTDPSVIATNCHVTGFLLGITAAIELIERGNVTTTLHPGIQI